MKQIMSRACDVHSQTLADSDEPVAQELAERDPVLLQRPAAGMESPTYPRRLSTVTSPVKPES